MRALIDYTAAVIRGLIAVQLAAARTASPYFMGMDPYPVSTTDMDL